MEIAKQLVIANCKRIIQILETSSEKLTKDNFYNPIKSELKIKMRELRRDTVELEYKMCARKRWNE